MTIGRLARPLVRVALAMLTLSSSAWIASAQTHDDHVMPSAAVHKNTAEQNELVEAVRDATERFRDVSRATAEGYALQFGCVSGGDFGAMGMHFVKGPLVGDGEVDVAHPEIVLYEPLPNGRLRLTGADFLVLADDWNKKHSGPPQLMGQLFHLFDSPNRFGLPAFYTLHVWAWKDNPNGTFTNWNPDVSCNAFNPDQQ